MKQIVLTVLALSAFVGVASAQVTLTQSATVPTPGPNDISQLLNTSQNNYTLNYYDNNSARPPGQTFTTGSSSVGYVITNLSVATAGSGNQNGGAATLNYTLYIYQISGTGNTNASLIYSSAPGQALNLSSYTSQLWLTWSGLNVALQPNTVYAYTIWNNVTSAYEEMANQSGQPYASGQICLIPPAGGLVTYGNGGASYSDATFDLGLAIPQIPVAQQPTYTPNVNPIYASSPVTLNESASGPAPLYYQWITDGGTGGSLAPVNGATSTNLAVNTTGFTPGNTYNYAVIVTNTFGSVTSSVVALIITNASAPVITSSSATPNTTTNFVGQSETYAVSAVGTLPIAYQWQFSTNADGSFSSNISGATNATLVLNNLQTTNTGYYSLLATNVVSPFTTNSAWTALTVVAITNEFITWSNPVSIISLTPGQILTNPPGTFLGGEYFGPNAGSITVTVNGTPYSFYGDGSVASVAGNIGSSTVAWTSLGDTTGDTNLDTVLNQMSFDGGTHAITLHNLTPGGQYAVQLFALDTRAIGEGRLNNFQDPNNAADMSQTFDMSAADYVIGTFTATSSTAVIQQNLLVGGAGNINALVVRGLSATAPVFSTVPSSVTAFAGRTVKLSGTANGVPIPTYQWQDGSGNNLSNVGQISGVTSNVLTIANVNLGNDGSQYVLVAKNSAGTNSTSAVTLYVVSVPSLSGAYSTNLLALHPLAYWPLNETSDPYNGGTGGVGVYDASGNNYDGVYQLNAYNGFDGIVGPQPADGYTNFTVGQGALSPESSTNSIINNSWVNLPALNLNTNTVTIIMWLYPSGNQNGATGLLVNRNAGTVAGMTYSGNTLGYVWNNNDSGTYSYTNGPVIPTNIWSMVALVVTPTNASFYVINTNGSASSTFSHNHNNMSWGGTTANIYLGADSQTTRIFAGTLDEAAVFNYALNSSQLQVLSGLASSVNTNAATLNFAATVIGAVGSQSMNFSWAPDHLGWQLYTNGVGLTATSSWFPVSGSASVTNEIIGISPSKTNVFFQMRYP